jgi:hypothetical protein
MILMDAHWLVMQTRVTVSLLSDDSKRLRLSSGWTFSLGPDVVGSSMIMFVVEMMVRCLVASRWGRSQ